MDFDIIGGKKLREDGSNYLLWKRYVKFYLRSNSTRQWKSLTFLTN